jgi:hypothetical protein
MEKQLKLYMVMLGCTPEGRLTEQHDIFFGIGTSKRINPTDEGFLARSQRTIHIDAWREVSLVDQFSITIEDRDTAVNTASEKLFLLTLEDIKKMNLKNTIIRY